VPANQEARSQMSETTQKSGSGSRGVDSSRRRWSEAHKRRIVAESYRGGESATAVARRHGVHSSVLFRWRRRYGTAADTRRGVCSGGGRGARSRRVRRRPGAWRLCWATTYGSSSTRRCMRRRWHGSLRWWGGDDSGSGGVRVWLATGVTDMRRGMNTLALQVQEGLGRDPHGGDFFVFRGRRGDLLKILWHDGVGVSLYTKRLERGRFPWPSTAGGAVSISAAQLGYLLEGIDWRNPVRTWRPLRAGVRSISGIDRSIRTFDHGAERIALLCGA